MIEEEDTVADRIEEGIAVDCAEEEDTAAGLAVGWNIAGEEDIAGLMEDKDNVADQASDLDIVEEVGTVAAGHNWVDNQEVHALAVSIHQEELGYHDMDPEMRSDDPGLEIVAGF